MSSHLPPSSGHDKETRPGNLLLAAVPADEYKEFRELLEIYPLRMRETLQEAGDQPDWVYFPTSGIISELTVLESGMMIEFGQSAAKAPPASPSL